MAVNLSPVGGVAAQFFTSTGAVLTGGKLFTYLAGTTTPAVTYTTSAGNVPWTNPVVLDAAGRVPGSGEIWLTDGLIYKFVLRDSNDVLIATYDNITGINSNAVAYTNQQDIQTATAGQTVFTLPISYQPGTNSLSVFVDGVNQYGPGAQYSYVETDANTVTFTAGLHAGALVKFTTAVQTTGNATDAAVVAYTPPFANAIATTVAAKLAQTVSVFDFMTETEIASVQARDGSVDVTNAIQAAFGGAGTTPDNTSVFFPNGKYVISAPIKIYRAGETLKNVSMIGESVDGVFFTYSTPTKGFVFGEPAVGDGLWGSNANTFGAATHTENVTVKNISHKFSDVGLWFVYCVNVNVDNIHGYDLVCLAAGNDAWDDCRNVRVTNVTRMNDGLDLSPDAWYSIGLYRCSGFLVDGFQSQYLPAASGTGGTHIVASACDFGQITNCNIFQTTASGNGITLEDYTHDVVVSNNSIWIVDGGIVTFGLNNSKNLIANNILDTCTDGIRPLARNSVFVGNIVRNSSNKDFYTDSVDSVPNTYIGNSASTFSFPSSIEQYQYFVSNPGVKQRIFIPAVDFKEYLPAGTQETHDPSTYRITNASGSIRCMAKLDTGGRAGDISNITFHFNRLIANTSVNCYTTSFNYAGGTVMNGEVFDTSSTTGVKSATITLYAGTSIPVSGTTTQLALYIPTAAGVAELIGVTFDFQETGANAIVSN